MKTVYILNGPNLNLLGTREPEIYGKTTLADVEKMCAQACSQAGLALAFSQSNHEGVLLDTLHEIARAVPSGSVAGVILNAGAYTHTSIALHDALKALPCYKIELHISNTFAREGFRHHSYLSAAVDAVMAGLGVGGYALAIQAIAEQA